MLELFIFSIAAVVIALIVGFYLGYHFKNFTSIDLSKPHDDYD